MSGHVRAEYAARGRGTLEGEKPPIFGMIQRGGEVVIHVLANVKQKKMAMDSMRFMLIQWKGFGLCCAPGYGPIVASRKKACPFISAFSSLYTMRKGEEKAFLILCCVCSSRNNLKRIMSLLFNIVFDNLTTMIRCTIFYKNNL